jgi:hypothetical protein
MSEFGVPGITLFDVPEASGVIDSPKRPWSAPRVILPTRLNATAKSHFYLGPTDSHSVHSRTVYHS